MSAVFKYQFDDFKAYSTSQVQNIVKSVKFTLMCEHMGQRRSSVRMIEFADPDFSNFTEFKNLTQDQILAWVTAHLGQEEIDALKFGMQSVIEQELARSDAPPALEDVKAPWF